LTAHHIDKSRMHTEFHAFDHVHPMGDTATHPLAHPATRLPLSLVVAGMSLLPPRFAADTRPNAPSGAPNCGFQDN
jgi:hypothetical protein